MRYWNWIEGENQKPFRQDASSHHSVRHFTMKRKKILFFFISFYISSTAERILCWAFIVLCIMYLVYLILNGDDDFLFSWCIYWGFRDDFVWIMGFEFVISFKLFVRNFGELQLRVKICFSFECFCIVGRF